MGHVFQVECWEKRPSGNHFLFIMARGELEKVMENTFEGKKGINWHLFMKIKEIGRKGR